MEEEILEWEDITSLIKDVSREMDNGQMIHSSTFSLQDSMSALELMDPKMDSGMNSDQLMTVDKALEQGLLPSELDSFQILAIIDELNACEATWHAGFSVAHTLFTCLYLHRLELVTSPILKSYIHGLLKTCDTVRNVIHRADVYEEEDYFPSMLGFVIGEDLKLEDVQHSLQAVENDLEQLKKASEEDKDGKGKKKKKDGDTTRQPLQSDPTKETEICEALLARFRYRKAVLQMHTTLAKPEAKGLQVFPKFLQRALEQIPIMRKTLSLGPTEAPGFNKTITRNIMPNSPPRDVKIMGREETIAYYEGLLNHIAKYSKYSELTTYDEILAYTHSLSALQPNIVARSHLLCLVHGPDNFFGRGDITPLLLASFSQFCSAVEGVLPPAELKRYLYATSRASCLVLRLLCENRTRQRKNLAGKLLGEWGVCQQESFRLDQIVMQNLEKSGVDFKAPGAPPRHPHFCWVYDQTVQLLAHFMSLGFELELFNPKELATAYWYLEYLCDLRLQNRNVNWRPKKKKAKAGKKEKKPTIGQSPPVTAEFLLIEAHMTMCHALTEAIFGFKKMDVEVPEFNPKYTDNWFLNRFSDFYRLQQPMPLTLDKWKRDFQFYEKESAGNLLQYSCKHFNDAKKLITIAQSHPTAPPEHSKPGLRQLIKVCISNAVLILGINKVFEMRGTGPEKAKLKLKFTFEPQAVYPILSVEKVEKSS